MEEEEEDLNSFSDARTLSGGERSIATLALLLAMGRNVFTPFRVMDEFDVFMDATARSIAIKQLVYDSRQPCTRGKRKQCIFLTPLNISSIPDAPDLRRTEVRIDKDTFGTGGNRTKSTTLDDFGYKRQRTTNEEE